MANRTKTESYYALYRVIQQEARIKVKEVVRELKFSGRGKAHSTISRRILRMYEEKISRNPQLSLKPFKNVQTTTYFCRKRNREDLTCTFHELHKNEQLNYVLHLAGDCDFFVTTREKTLDLRAYDLEIKEMSKLFTPLFTVPHGWNLPWREALRSFLNHEFVKGALPRETGGVLEWADLDRRIYEMMRENVRVDFNYVARRTGVYPETVKAHFYKKVLPACTVLHYFFPKGYDFYRQTFLRVRTEYESSFVKALERLPCTTYVYPLEEGLAVNVFHESSNDLMTVFKKLEEMRILNYYLPYVPVTSVI